LYILYFNDTLTLKNTNTNYVTSNSIMLIVKISNFVRRTRTKLKLGDNQSEKILTRAVGSAYFNLVYVMLKEIWFLTFNLLLYYLFLKKWKVRHWLENLHQYISPLQHHLQETSSGNMLMADIPMQWIPQLEPFNELRRG
jgi:hypothetical protein